MGSASLSVRPGRSARTAGVLRPSPLRPAARWNRSELLKQARVWSPSSWRPLESNVGSVCVQVSRDSSAQTAGSHGTRSRAQLSPCRARRSRRWRLLQLELLGSAPQVRVASVCVALGRICIPERFPDDPDAAGPWMHFKNRCAGGLLLGDRLGTFHVGLKRRIPSDVPLGQRGFEPVSKGRRRCPLRVSPPSVFCAVDTCFQSPGAASCCGSSRVGLLSLGP